MKLINIEPLKLYKEPNENIFYTLTATGEIVYGFDENFVEYPKYWNKVTNINRLKNTEIIEVPRVKAFCEGDIINIITEKGIIPITKVQWEYIYRKLVAPF
ncbi:hypothetical protein [Clostridium thermobutyricum]|uniref:hypothetical protein n=1 Tax=Clostridium thermobutyricum TaxID=29372 RepID=UPI0018A8EF53|nr:hypothetical protein [Clostridium thermobutyricum]